jgi:NitT/TauT family transport system ATP-binding protein
MIELHGVSKVYPTRKKGVVRALDGLDLRVEDGEFLTLVGPSGCGKSTVLKLVSGLLAPSSGRIVVDGEAVTGPRREMGFVFQTPVLLPWRSVRDNVLLPIEMLGRPLGPHRERADRLLEQVGLADFRGAHSWELSGGMQQRVGICRALVHDPSTLLMDEPFAALDAMTREALGFELLRIWEASRKTVLFVTHSIPEAVLLADRVVVMTPRPGRIAGVIPIDLPRPRTLDQQYETGFEVAAKAIRRLIEHGGGPGGEEATNGRGGPNGDR